MGFTRQPHRRRAAANAKLAGFNGVEFHAANGYLIDQFLRKGTNQPTDEKGGVASNRVRFLAGFAKAVLPSWNCEQIGTRISPTVALRETLISEEILQPVDWLEECIGLLASSGIYKAVDTGQPFGRPRID